MPGPTDCEDSPRLQGKGIDALIAANERIVITGAGGWLGLATLELLHNTLGKAAFEKRVVAFGSSARTLDLRDGLTVAQRPLTTLAQLDFRPTLVLHTAFVTMDKVATMSREEYVAANVAIREIVLNALDRVGATKLFVASSGAAEFADASDAAPALALYGGLKKEDERLFSAWAKQQAGRKTLITRIFSLTGPYINKPETYAFADFVRTATKGEVIRLRSSTPQIRSYVAIRELMSLIFSLLSRDWDTSVIAFDTGGEPVELGDLAQRISDRLGGAGIERPHFIAHAPNRYASSNESLYRTLRVKADVPDVSPTAQIHELTYYLAAPTVALA